MGSEEAEALGAVPDPKKSKKGTAGDVEMETKAKAKGKAKAKSKGKETKYKVTTGEACKSLPTLVKATCSSLQSARELEGTANDNMIFPSDHNILVAMKAATKTWQEKIVEIGKGHGLGPPYLPAWEAFLATLISEDVGGAAKKSLAVLEEKLKQLPQQERLLVIRVCKAKVTYDQGFSRVTLALRGFMEEHRAELLEAAKQAGAELKFGKAPPSNLERQLQQMLSHWAEAAEE